MKILFTTHTPAPYRGDFFNELGKLCDLTVLYECKKAGYRDAKWQGDRAEHYKEIFLEGKQVTDESAICFSVFKYLKDKSYDLIVVGIYSTPTGMMAILYLNNKGIPFILNIDGGFIKDDAAIIRMVKKYFLSSPAAWLSSGGKPTEYLLHYGARKENIYRYPFTSLKKEDILPEIVSDEKKKMMKSKLKINEPKMVVSVGQFIPRKGFDVLMNACRDIDENTGIYIIGGEPSEEYLQLKETLALENVHFVGFKTKAELKEYYLAADLFVLPTREDIWGLVVNEAMAYGLPVITTDKCVAGLELVKDDENGFIVPVGDEKALAEKIDIVLADDDLCRNMAKKSLEKISEYTIENMAKVHMAIFEKILAADKK